MEKAKAGDHKQPGIWKSFKRYTGGYSATSFSILFARYKGELETMIAGVAALNKIRTGDKIRSAKAAPITDSAVISEL